MCTGKYQKAFQLLEAALESLPEVILQSVFIIRSVNDPYLIETEKEDGNNVNIDFYYNNCIININYQ